MFAQLPLLATYTNIKNINLVKTLIIMIIITTIINFIISIIISIIYGHYLGILPINITHKYYL